MIINGNSFDIRYFKTAIKLTFNSYNVNENINKLHFSKREQFSFCISKCIFLYISIKNILVDPEIDYTQVGGGMKTFGNRK